MQNPEMIGSLYSGKVSKQSKLLEGFDQSNVMISYELYQSSDVRTSCVHVLLEGTAAHFATWQGWCCMPAKSLCHCDLEVQQSGDNLPMVA